MNESESTIEQNKKPTPKLILWIVLGVLAAAVLFCGIYFTVRAFGANEPPAITPADSTPTDAAADTTLAEITTPTVTVPSETTTEKPVLPVKPDKMIALTFDDGPSISITPKILDILERYDAKATFFVLGSNLTSSKMLEFRRAIAMGCEIGNHSWSHANLTGLSNEEILREIKDTNDKIAELSCNGYVSSLLRPPGGHINRAVMDALYADGVRMHAILWNCDSRDWEFNAAWKNHEITEEEAVERAYALVMSEVENGGIVLMHDIKEITPALLERVLERLSAEGYTFVTVSELIDFKNMGEDAYTSKFYSQKRAVPMT